MPKIKTIAALIISVLTAAPAFAQIILPAIPSDQDQKQALQFDVQHPQIFDWITLHHAAVETNNDGRKTLLVLSGDSGGSGHNVSFLAEPYELFINNSGIVLDLTQADNVALTSTANSPPDSIELESDDSGWAVFYSKKNAGVLSNRGIIGAYNGIGVWLGSGSSTHELNNSGGIHSDLVAVAVQGDLETLNNSGYLNGKESGIYITPSGTVGMIKNSGDIQSHNFFGVPIVLPQSYAIYNEGTITGPIINTGTLEHGIYNAGTVMLNNSNTINSDLNNAGTLMMKNGASVATTLKGNLTNSGSLILNPTSHSAGNTLTINGDYTGTTGSVISLGAVLAGDSSLTDKLVVTGDTSGESTLNITNENGSGAQTLEGIQLISVGGHSDALFKQGGRVVAGAWDYILRKGNTSGTDTKGWYLTSYAATTVHRVRPEAASYVANLQAVNSLFNTALHDRTGETQYQDALTGEVRTTSLWLRNEGGRSAFSLSDGQNKTAANRYIMQLGGNVFSGTVNGNDRYDVGVMGGYANQHSNTHNSLTGYDSKGSVDGYSTGLYSAWYQNATEKLGLYMDGWLQYSWFNNEVKGQDLSPETYKSHGLTASLETGYTLRVGEWKSAEGMDNAVFIQPHAQAVWMGVKADNHAEDNGTWVSGSGNNNVQTKLGLRAYLNGKSVLDKDTVREFQPFVDASWIYNTQQTGVSMGGTAEHITGTRNDGELKAGLEGKISRRLSVWTSVAQQMGGAGYSDTEGELGIKYQF